jgi:uncharacterized protein with PIN domain
MRRLLCDALLGKPATYLRKCGHDAASALEGDVQASDGILAWAAAEGRTLLARNAALAARAPDAIHVEAHEPTEQLAELRHAGVDLALRAEPERYRRCDATLTTVGADESRPDDAPPPIDSGRSSYPSRRRPRR